MVESKIGTVKQGAIRYPCLMISSTRDLIVLFSEEKKGMVIKSESSHPSGYYSEGWFMDRFNVFDGSITLKNV